jgi:cyanophycin synthetase
MGHIVEHVALELQELVGMHVGFGRTRETSTPGVYQVVFEYLNEEAGRYAGRAAVRLCQSIVDRGRYPKAELEQDLQDLKDLWRDAALGPSTESIVKEAEKKGIPWMQLGARFLIQLGYGVNQKRIQATMTDKTGILGVELACDKEATKRVLANAGVPVPKGTVINFLDDLEEAIEYVGGYPIVIKPLDGNHGRGITIDIQNWQEAEAAYDAARQVSRSIIVERYYQGRDHRVLVVDGKVVAVAERVPAHVIGDGRSSIAELIEETNKDPNRGEGHDNVLTKIELDRTSYQLLERQGYTLDSVLSKDEICYLRATANLSTGGIAVDRTDEIHPENVWLAQRVVKIVGLDIAGIDVVTSDISRPLREVDGVIVEVNALPAMLPDL